MNLLHQRHIRIRCNFFRRDCGQPRILDHLHLRRIASEQEWSLIDALDNSSSIFECMHAYDPVSTDNACGKGIAIGRLPLRLAHEIANDHINRLRGRDLRFDLPRDAISRLCECFNRSKERNSPLIVWPIISLRVMPPALINSRNILQHQSGNIRSLNHNHATPSLSSRPPTPQHAPFINPCYSTDDMSTYTFQLLVLRKQRFSFTEGLASAFDYTPIINAYNSPQLRTPQTLAPSRRTSSRPATTCVPPSQTMPGHNNRNPPHHRAWSRRHLSAPRANTRLQPYPISVRPSPTSGDFLRTAKWLRGCPQRAQRPVATISSA